MFSIYRKNQLQVIVIIEYISIAPLVLACKIDDDTIYAHGDLWNPSDCQECECMDGKIICKQVMCADPNANRKSQYYKQ